MQSPPSRSSRWRPNQVLRFIVLLLRFTVASQSMFVYALPLILRPSYRRISLIATWGGEQLLPSKYASDLKQLDNGKKVLPRGWKCERCELTTNLWMNLTDGAINCGRRYHDGTGGNNHAVEHYQETKYPLVMGHPLEIPIRSNCR